jgi:hypothetical protein
MTSLIPAHTDSELLDVNRHLNAPWTDARLIEPERFNTWPLVRSLLEAYPPTTGGYAYLSMMQRHWV